jgi:peptidoglycan-N-acetylglucosamine deacetylase
VIRRAGGWIKRLSGSAIRSRVALTIDTEHPDAPAAPDNPRRLLDMLASEHVPATFFLQGQWALAYPELARRIADEGHLIGNHSHWHAPMTALSELGFRDSVQLAEEAIKAASGVTPRPWFRCPYGDGMRHPRVLTLLRDLGYRNIAWEIAAGDWRPDASADAVVRAVVRGLRSQGDGARVLLHSWPDVTVAALPMVLAAIRRAGAELVRLDALPDRPEEVERQQ